MLDISASKVLFPAWKNDCVESSESLLKVRGKISRRALYEKKCNGKQDVVYSGLCPFSEVNFFPQYCNQEVTNASGESP
jgi:hypothetical protein